MSSAICQNFVQNAWKKELCSNCFKSKDEHAAKPKPKPIQLISNDKIEGIIKIGKKSKPKLSVAFLKDLTEVIGYGGEDWCSDNEEEEEVENDESDNDFIIESEDEEEAVKELKRITKENTDFNTVSLGNEVKKSHAQLLLGKPLVDSSGKKQTLLVSVTPYGEEPSAPTKKYTKTLSHIPIAKNNKDVIAETKSNVILTSYTKNSEDNVLKEEKSLLDEISETLENSKNPIQIIKKKSQSEKAISPNESNKENEKVVENCKTENKKELTIDNKLSQLNRIVSEKKISLSRTPALKRDIEKPVIYQTSTKVELLNTRNLKLNKETANTNNKAKDEENKNEKIVTQENHVSDIKENIANTTKLIEAEKLYSKNELYETKTKEIKDEINLTVAEKSTEEKVVGLPPPVPPKYSIALSQTREQAGKPDGREDPVVIELPPLPVTPPPVLETQSSFLHGITAPIYEKPKIPSKPSVMLLRKPIAPNIQASPTQQLTTFVPEKPIEKMPLTKQDSNETDYKMNKRRAPKPPEDNSMSIYSRNSMGAINIDSPVVREKEKRERAASCTPKMLGVNDIPSPESDYSSPEPAPRKSLSVSTDCLATEDKRREKTKGRFSLKKFLRMGSSKDVSKIGTESTNTKPDDNDLSPQPKPRLVIVHPSELNGAKVEVVTKPMIDHLDHPFGHEYSSPLGEYETYNLPRTTTKPPPPPRNFSEVNIVPKPALPPPKSVEIINKQRQISRNNSVSKKTETVYANIGEVRSAIVPNKPVRTASMREREAQQQKQMRKNHNYEPINVNGVDSTENVYDYINSTRSSSPDSDSSREKNSPKIKTVRLGKRSESSIDVSGEYFKYGNIPRSMSLTYCGSETESEIYSPYGFYGSESEVTEDDHDWIQNGRTHKLRSRKGRSIVHKNLEDNYGAVVVANHEALAQVLENIHQTNHIQPALRGLKNSPNLRWSDFSMKSGISPVIIGTRAFHQALWGAQHVTLVVNAGTVSTSSTLSLGTFNLTPVTEFSDLVPNDYLPKPDKDRDGDSSKQVQATISVLPWLQVNTIQSYNEVLQSKMLSNEETWKDSNFIMLQFVNALKTLQAQGIEELPVSLNSFVLCKDMDKDSNHRLCVLQGLTTDVSMKSTQEKYGSLCVCALKALSYLQTSPKITSLLQSLLNHERAVSLTQVKSILEFSLWGPTDVSLGSTIKERELGLQRWLDLQRATVLHGLVCARVQLTVYEEFHLLFLVRSNARMMSDASLLIESSNMKHSVTSIQGKVDKYVAS